MFLFYMEDSSTLTQRTDHTTEDGSYVRPLTPFQRIAKSSQKSGMSPKELFYRCEEIDAVCLLISVCVNLPDSGTQAMTQEVAVRD